MVDTDRARECVSSAEQIEFARALFEKLEGISRQRSSIDEARRHFRILELMKR